MRWSVVKPTWLLSPSQESQSVRNWEARRPGRRKAGSLGRGTKKLIKLLWKICPLFRPVFGLTIQLSASSSTLQSTSLKVEKFSSDLFNMGLVFKTVPKIRIPKAALVPKFRRQVASSIKFLWLEASYICLRFRLSSLIIFKGLTKLNVTCSAASVAEINLERLTFEAIVPMDD